MATRRQIYAVYRGKETKCERKNDLLFGNRRPT